MVADHPDDQARHLARWIAALGHEARVCCDGVADLEAMADFAPEVAILGLAPARRDGHEMARRIREQPWGRDALVVALLDAADHGERRSPKWEAFDVLLLKPIGRDVLQHLLDDRGSRR